MLLKREDQFRTMVFIAVAATAIIFIAYGIVSYLPQKIEENKITAPIDNKNGLSNNERTDSEEVVQSEIVVLPVIDYNDLNDDQKDLKKMMQDRKDEIGLDNSIDMVIKSDEEFQIGNVTVSMRDILEKAFIEKGEIFEEKIKDSGAFTPEIIKKYGVYVVQPGDNIWNVHFIILKDFYKSKGVDLQPQADEPIDKGKSSGIGKILKFSEKMVIIYNIVEKKIEKNINLLEPLSKIIVYNMDEVFSLLEEIKFENVDKIQFDGTTIWIPAKDS